jgi:hypothetical protein
MNPVEVDIRLTVQDLFLVRLIQFTRRPWIVGALGAMMLLLFSLFIVSIAIYHDPNYMMFAEFCFIGFMIPVMLFVSTKRYYKSAKYIQEPLHYTLTSTELHATSPNYSSVLPLSHAWKIQETREYFLVWESTVAAHVLPKRSFRNAEEVARVRGLLIRQHSRNGAAIDAV